MKKTWLLALPVALSIGIAGALAQTKEVTFAHQDMIVPMRALMASGELEKATGYRLASTDRSLGPPVSPPRPARNGQADKVSGTVLWSRSHRTCC